MMLLWSGVTSSRPMQGVPRSSWTMRAMTTLNRSRTNCGLPSERDPELSTTSTVQMLPSGSGLFNAVVLPSLRPRFERLAWLR